MSDLWSFLRGGLMTKALRRELLGSVGWELAKLHESGLTKRRPSSGLHS